MPEAASVAISGVQSRLLPTAQLCQRSPTKTKTCRLTEQITVAPAGEPEIETKSEALAAASAIEPKPPTAITSSPNCAKRTGSAGLTVSPVTVSQARVAEFKTLNTTAEPVS